MVALFVKPSIVVAVLCLFLGTGVVDGQQQQQQWRRRNSSPRVRGQTVTGNDGSASASYYKKQKGSSSSVVMPDQEIALVTGTAEGGGGAGRDLQIQPIPDFGFGVNIPIFECETGKGKGKGGKRGKKSSKKSKVSPYCDTGLPPETCLICAIGFCLCLDCFSFPEFCQCYQEFVDDTFNEPGTDYFDYLEALFFCWCDTAGDELFGSTIDPICSARRNLMDWDVASELGSAGFGGGQTTSSTTGVTTGGGPALPEGFNTTLWTRYDITTEQTTTVVWCNDYMEDTPLCKDCAEGQFCCMEIPTGPVCVDEADETEVVGAVTTIPTFPDIGGASWMG